MSSNGPIEYATLFDRAVRDLLNEAAISGDRPTRVRALTSAGALLLGARFLTALAPLVRMSMRLDKQMEKEIEL